MKILIASRIDSAAFGQLCQRHDVRLALDATDAQLRAESADRECIVFRSGVEVTAEVIQSAPDLKLLVRAGSGLDNVDVDRVRDCGLTLVTIPQPGARAVAEMTFALMLSLARQVVLADQLLRRGRWASGFSMSAAFGVRDSNEASWTQVVEVAEFMADATTIPILFDADNGFGDFNNVRRLVRKLEQRSIAGVCIEDKIFPKRNSFTNGRPHVLANIDEFTGKIRAAKDAQEDTDFCVIARVEALIAERSLGEAIRRAEAYALAGADAVLVHSKISTPEEILAFMARWDRRCPIVIVPTTYFRTPPVVFQQAGVSVAIWANQLMRSSVAAMQRVARRLSAGESLADIDDEIASVDDVFRLQNVEELYAAEREYLPREVPRESTNGRSVYVDSLGAVPHPTPKPSPQP